MSGTKLAIALSLCFAASAWGGPEAVMAKGELTSTSREALKAQWDLVEDTEPYVFTGHDGASFEQWFKFSKSYSITNLPFEAKQLEPYLEIKVLDVEEISVKHQTKEEVVPLITLPAASGSLFLNAPVLRFTNSWYQAGFYTQVFEKDQILFGGALASALGTDKAVFLNLKIRNKKRVFTLRFKNPEFDWYLKTIAPGHPDLTPEEKIEWDLDATRNRLTEKLGAPKDYYTNYCRAHRDPERRQYDYDLLHNSVVTYLREAYGIPVDMILYTHEFALAEGTGRYIWGIFHDRALLEDAETRVTRE